MSEKITVYEKPTCSKCREMVKVLKEKGIDFEKVNYYIEPLDESKLSELIGKMKISPRELLRSSEAKYKELNLANSKHSDQELISLMVKYPELMQRPIVEKGSRAVLGRPTENVNKLL
ncbi:MAG: arsenate reductase (glutaredoxin) [Candidatus Obscuribacterales bacterium]|nr:arsenate reductase (glutaredoxin) [Candidatus Obscuribacterales bacterium]